MNRRTVESAAAQAENQRFELEAAYLTLSSNVALAPIDEAALRGQLAAQEEMIKADTELADIVRREYTLGEAAQADLLQQQAVLAQAQAALPPLEQQRALQRDALTALVGCFPNEDLAAHFDLADLHLPDNLPVSLPSRLVEQRPDIRAAAATLHARGHGGALSGRRRRLVVQVGRAGLERGAERSSLSRTTRHIPHDTNSHWPDLRRSAGRLRLFVGTGSPCAACADCDNPGRRLCGPALWQSSSARQIAGVLLPARSANTCRHAAGGDGVIALSTTHCARQSKRPACRVRCRLDWACDSIDPLSGADVLLRARASIWARWNKSTEFRSPTLGLVRCNEAYIGWAFDICRSGVWG
ncbi:TolC family protein [Paraburkholderia sp. UCT2]|uniref:TolC family protein n=1 Tax=Paraburkholderia sp. UCT2 TaxID=2615208 RepID=UPI00223BF400